MPVRLNHFSVVMYRIVIVHEMIPGFYILLPFLSLVITAAKSIAFLPPLWSSWTNSDCSLLVTSTNILMRFLSGFVARWPSCPGFLHSSTLVFRSYISLTRGQEQQRCNDFLYREAPCGICAHHKSLHYCTRTIVIIIFPSSSASRPSFIYTL